MARTFSGARLRGLRTASGLSREQLAVTAGKSMSAVIAYEQGREAPGVNAAAALAEALGTTVDALLGDPGEGQGGG